MNTMDVQSQHTWTMKQKIKKILHAIYAYAHKSSISTIWLKSSTVDAHIGSQ